jgi:hypothetical protein
MLCLLSFLVTQNTSAKQHVSILIFYLYLTIHIDNILLLLKKKYKETVHAVYY